MDGYDSFSFLEFVVACHTVTLSRIFVEGNCEEWQKNLLDLTCAGMRVNLADINKDYKANIGLIINIRIK